MKTALSLLAIALVFSSSVLGAKCGSQDCGKDSPCCVKGFCNANAMYCAPFSCEPENSFAPQSCWGTPHCVDQTADFGANPAAFAPIAEYHGAPHKTQYVSQLEPSNARVQNGQMELQLVRQPDGKGFGAVTIGTRAIQYGTVTAVLRSGCLSGGVVSSFIIRNGKVGDEIDMEFVGADTATVQSNYYWHGELDYTKMIKSPAVIDTARNFHIYQIDWTPDHITWQVDNVPFRTLRRTDTWDPQARVFKFPEAESFVSFSVWDGGSGAQGTRDWAGGYVDWSRAPFVLAVKSVAVSCFYKGNETTYTPPLGA
ncbi:putative glycosidase CRH2 [Coemansia biformis]|uniref:Glycosidase CRH2 n=1 Tax=Coemansia biformis TaxID=1286918 RepID=A0A9W7YHP6_9FUNG|nr:putative glycosidase CRH2 [Coemansia biformis]